MDEAEAKRQERRIEDYRTLEKERRTIDAALAVLDTPTGVHKQSAFTGNARESRRIVEIKVWFSETVGGEPRVDLEIPHLDLPADKVGSLLREMLLTQQERAIAKMREI